MIGGKIKKINFVWWVIVLALLFCAVYGSLPSTVSVNHIFADDCKDFVSQTVFYNINFLSFVLLVFVVFVLDFRTVLRLFLNNTYFNLLSFNYDYKLFDDNVLFLKKGVMHTQIYL